MEEETFAAHENADVANSAATGMKTSITPAPTAAPKASSAVADSVVPVFDTSPAKKKPEVISAVTFSVLLPPASCWGSLAPSTHPLFVKVGPVPPISARSDVLSSPHAQRV